VNDIAVSTDRGQGYVRSNDALIDRSAAMRRHNNRVAEMIGLASSIAAFRHTALLVTESVIAEADPIDRTQEDLDRLRSTIDRLEIALELRRRQPQPDRF